MSKARNLPIKSLPYSQIGVAIYNEAPGHSRKNKTNLKKFAVENTLAYLAEASVTKKKVL